ncbi:CheR family methyltransferase [Solimonas marina]|uniref:Protein-glutamate O-methyltransferase CheR n=1 Tax=Solimonas marina TaxID=2714601 RepID=A0A969WAM0_9GAMM|nr:protein-glutamate O-methyltransferase CheR [Solimonas marina]NKF22585.1 protein-glutamate O-methyltransferase CheR [Solimonas marina]
MDAARREEIEIELFVQALRMRYGYDFSQYAHASFKRRVQNLAMHFGCANIAQMTERVLHDTALIPEVIAQLSVPVSEMFRDPEVFECLRRDIFPVLASYPHFNIWHAGCAHGEEIYSMAILLQEAGLYERAQIYATDISAQALETAKDGIYAARHLQQWAANYLRAGGQRTLSDYFHSRYGHLKLDESLNRNIVFAQHNLAADGVFCEAHLILCRNVLIYFKPDLQRRAVELFRTSLVRGGHLCLGTKESLTFTGCAASFGVVSGRNALYRLLDHGTHD